MARKTRNYKKVAGAATILSLILAVGYYLLATKAEGWERWTPVGLFLLVAVVAYIRYRKL